MYAVGARVQVSATAYVDVAECTQIGKRRALDGKSMETHDAVAALRELADLPAPRRAHLMRQAIHAPTDADRAELVRLARFENIDVRLQNRADAKAEYTARLAAMAQRDASQNAPETPQTPASRRYSDPDGLRHPEARPVTTTWTTPRKPDSERMPVRREGIGANHAQRVAERERVEQVSPVVVLEVNPKTGAPLTHGSNGYRLGCRCSECRVGKRESRTPKGKRRPNGELAPHGTLTRYKTCKCDECRTVAVDHARQYRARTRGKSTLDDGNR